MDISAPTPEMQPLQQAQQLSSSVSGGPQLRSRVTVVCAECKRLKLKCDRRTPCGSCTKRDTVARCIYSAAAAEKVDLHSLHNRLSQVESQLAQFSAPGARFQTHHPRVPGPSPHADRMMLPVGKSGSSLTISLDDITNIWLDELDLAKEILPVQEPQHQPSCLPYASPSYVKLESSLTSLPDQPPSTGPELPIPLLLPPMSAYFTTSPPSHEPPCVTSRLMAHLPFAPRKRQRLYDNVEDVLKMYPCFNFKHFKDRAEAMFRWTSESGLSDLDVTSSVKPESNTTEAVTTQSAELARAIFFGSPSATPFSPTKAPASAKPTISFFAAVAAAFALGTLVDREVADEEMRIMVAARSEGVVIDDPSTSRAPSRRRHEASSVQGKKNKGTHKETASSPSVLLALSQQALSLSEKSSSYDLDFLVTMVLHVLYTLHDSKVRVAHHLLPNVGKMVNIARIMGLDSDPDEFPGTFNLFEAEARRRLWWDVFYYDLFVSDYMGRSPLISDTEHTTRLPLDVDEDVFTPACTSIPLPRSPLSLLEPNVSDFKYFGLKCRLAQLIKDIKKRSFKDSLQYDPEAQERYSLDQAVSCANDIQQWLTNLPAPFRLDIDSDSDAANLPEDASDSPLFPPSCSSSTVSPVLLAQRCELMVTAQRLLMKVYIPFLRPSNSHACSTTHLHATVGVFDAAHAIIRAVRALCSMWKQRPDLKGKRPTPALFSFCSFRRILFDAAVACAHSAVKYPTKFWVPTAMEDVNYAMEMLRDPMLNTGRGPMRGGVEGDVQEPVMIINHLQKKVEMARKGNPDGSGSRTKRKRDEAGSDTERIPNGFQLPPMGSADPSTDFERSPPVLTPHSGPGVIVAKSTQTSKGATPPEEPRKPATPPAPPCPKRLQIEPRDPKSKDKNGKKPSYPQTGYRVRPGKEPPFCKDRSISSTSATPEPTVNSESVAPSAPPPCQTPDRSSHTISFAQPSQRTSSPGIQKVLHRLVTQGQPEEGSVEFRIPLGATTQGQRRSHLSQPQQYMVSDESDPSQYPKIPPDRSSYEQNRVSSHTSPLSYTPYSDVSSSYSTSGPGAISAPQMSHTASAQQQQSPSFIGEIPGPPGDYFLFNTQYGGNMNDAPIVSLGINPSMTLHTGGENTPSLEDVSRGGLFHHHQEESQQPVYLRKPSDHHHSMSQPQFSRPPPQPVTRPWSHENAMQDNGFSYGQFMTS